MTRRIESHEIAGPAGRLEALLEEPLDREPWCAAVVCHPHPLHGGTLHNKVVYRLARGLRRAGLVVLRFNYRGVGRSQGEYGNLEGEIEDARAAIEWLRARHPGLPYALAGFSFGARVITRLACETAGARFLLAAGFPTSMGGAEYLERCATPKDVYKRQDFILFYPQLEEAAEAQEKVCKMQYQQMDKADRDPLHARRTEDECRQLLVQFPNSKFAPDAQQYLRTAQEVLGDSEYRVGAFYYRSKGSFPAAANRLNALTDQFPLYSRADDALMLEADSYHRMGDRWEDQEAAAYSRIVRDYPLSPHVSEATSHLKAMNRPVPEADPVAYARQKYEMENRQKKKLLSKAWGPFSSHPDVLNVAKSGSPRMETLKPYTPVSIPPSAKGGEATGNTGVSSGGGGGSDVTVSTVNDSKLIDVAPDARQNSGAAPAPAAGAASGKTGTGGTAENPAGVPAKPVPDAALPQNHTGKITAAQQAKMIKHCLLYTSRCV